MKERVLLIIVTTKPDYVPPGITLRERISAEIITAEGFVSDLHQLRTDPNVLVADVSRSIPRT